MVYQPRHLAGLLTLAMFSCQHTRNVIPGKGKVAHDCHDIHQNVGNTTAPYEWNNMTRLPQVVPSLPTNSISIHGHGTLPRRCRMSSTQVQKKHGISHLDERHSDVSGRHPAESRRAIQHGPPELANHLPLRVVKHVPPTHLDPHASHV
jgi:hypothetical protein